MESLINNTDNIALSICFVIMGLLLGTINFIFRHSQKKDIEQLEYLKQIVERSEKTSKEAQKALMEITKEFNLNTANNNKALEDIVKQLEVIPVMRNQISNLEGKIDNLGGKL